MHRKVKFLLMPPLSIAQRIGLIKAVGGLAEGLRHATAAWRPTEQEEPLRAAFLALKQEVKDADRV